MNEYVFILLIVIAFIALLFLTKRDGGKTTTPKLEPKLVVQSLLPILSERVKSLRYDDMTKSAMEKGFAGFKFTLEHTKENYKMCKEKDENLDKFFKTIEADKEALELMIKLGKKPK